MNTPVGIPAVARPIAVAPAAPRVSVARAVVGHAAAGGLLPLVAVGPWAIHRVLVHGGSAGAGVAVVGGGAALGAWAALLRRGGLGELAATRWLLPLMLGALAAVPLGASAAGLAGAAAAPALVVSAATALWARARRHTRGRSPAA